MLLWLGGPQARQGFHAVGQILTVPWIFDSSLRPSEGAGSCNVKGSEMTNGIFSAFSQAARTASAAVRQCPISNRFAIHSPTSLFGPS
jgi:hypothetical protein